MSPTSWASRIRPHSSSRHAPALSTTLAWCGPCCGPSAAALTWCTIQTCPRCGVSLCSAIVRCPARLAGSRSWRPERRCQTVPFVPGSTLSTRCNSVHYLHLRHDRLPEGRDALPQHHPERGRPRVSHGDHARRHHPHVSSTLPHVWLLGGDADVDGDRRPAAPHCDVRSEHESTPASK